MWTHYTAASEEIVPPQRQKSQNQISSSASASHCLLFLPLKKVCSGVIGVFLLFFLGSREEGRPFFLQIYTEPPEKLRAETSQAAAWQHGLWLLLKHKVLHSWNKIYPAFAWLWCFPQGTKQGGLQAASSRGLSRHDCPAKWREVGVIP